MNVLLLRQREGDGDKYHKQLENPLITNVTSIPVLDFEFYNQDLIRSFIENINRYGGLIFTSKRAVTAFKKVVNEEQLLEIKNREDFTIYVVGRTTEECVIQLGLCSKGADTGNAKELSGLIIDKEKDIDKPLMFMCGNLARETIPTCLNESNIPNESISCYKTVPDQNFPEKLKQYVDIRMPDVIVFFSPSGAEFHLETIRKIIPDFKDCVKVACIGEYTSVCVTKLNVMVSGVADKPTPNCLLEVIKKL